MLCGMTSNTGTPRSSHAGSPKAKQFGKAIREARGDEPSLRAVAKELNIDPSRLSKIETGKVVPKPDLARKILKHVGVPDEQAEELMKMLEGAETEQPWHANTLLEQRQHLAAIVDFEDVAETIVSCTLGGIPGLLQPKRYAHAVMSGGMKPLPPSEVNIRVMTRMGRQGVLSLERARPARLVALIHQTAIEQNVGGPEVTVEMLEYLLKMMKRRNLEIRIVPDGVGWHEGLEGSFTLIEPRADADLYPVVFLEYRTSGLILHADEDVAAYRDAVESVQRLAMDASGTEAAITRAINEMRNPDERT